MTDALRPRDAKDVQDAVTWALSEGKTLEVVGRGSKRALGRPSQSDLTLDLSGLNGVTLYEPEELVLSARAGTPLAEVLRSQAQDVRELGRRRLMESGGRKEIAMMVPVVFLVLPVTVLFAVYPGLVSLDLQL